MSFSRRDFLTIAGGTTVAALLGGCAAGGGPKGSSAPGPSSASPTSSAPGVSPSSSAAASLPADQANKASYWAAFNSTEQSQWFQTDVVDTFNATSTRGTVKLTAKPVANYLQAVQLALTAGHGPDVLGAGIPQFVDWNRAGYVRPLDDIAAAAGWEEKFQPWALDLGRVDGKLLWLPDQVETMFVFYSPSVFAANGWTFPTSKAEFEALCQDAKSRGMTPVAAGNADWQAASEWHLGFYLNASAGPEAVYQGLTGKLRWTDPVFVDALSQLNGYMNKGWYGGGPDRYFTNKFDAMYRDLAAGKAAFIFTGSWGLAEIPAFFGSKAGNHATWDWKMSPPLSTHAPSDVYQLSVGQTVGINAKSPAPGLAGSFIDYSLTNLPLAVAGLTKVAYEPAPIKFTASDFGADMDPRTSRVYQGIGSATTIGYTTWTFWPGPIDAYMVQNIDKVFVGKLTPEKFLQGLDAMYQVALKAGKTQPIPKPAQ